MKTRFLLIALILMPILYSCSNKKGCTDPYSVNYDSEAEENDGSCRYSTVTFYIKDTTYSTFHPTTAQVYINDSAAGTAFLIFNDPPLDCATTGTIIYQFQNGNAITWKARVQYGGGSAVWCNGTVSPGSGLGCIKVNVAR